MLTGHFNGRPVALRRKETLLDAALRSGVELPSSCRVGGCGTCKCRVASGEVRELTETGYLLSAAEIAQGYVLACQSVAKTDVTIEYEPRREGIRGHVVGQEKVTRDITHLTIQLEAALDYRAGQFGDLTLDRLPGVTRSYSFATPPRPDGIVELYVRHVEGGELSTLVQLTNLVGEPLRIDGPHGDFWLRPGERPIVCVAGGSGLPPILAMLEECRDRDVTLIFGVRTEADLYALEAIRTLEARGRFTFVPVVGPVTEKVAALATAEHDAYLCGPPAMIDAAVDVLSQAGVPRERIRFDRFTTRADAAAQASARPTAGLFAYLRYFLFHAIGLLATASLLGGGRVTTAGLLGVLTLYILGDALAGDDTSTPEFRRPWIMTAQLWLALPLLALIVFSSVWTMASGDPLGFGALVTRLTGYDVLAARAATAGIHHFSGFVLTGLMIGMVGTIPAHELTHRTWDRVSMALGRWLLAFSFDVSFAIEHVYGHHRYVATIADPATAPRGRSVYAHVLVSTIRGNVSAWKIEADRLAKKGRSVWSVHNALIRGYAMSAALVAAAWAMGGARAAGFFVASALWGKALLEIVNYMEHYGIVRDPRRPVEPRHSWNTNRRVSSWAMFNLTRHSHHHAQGEVPYHELRPYPEAPMMIAGYLTTIVIALIPPVWHRLMAPKLAAWDREFATADELRLLPQHRDPRAHGAKGLDQRPPALQRQP
ncbi:MAG: fatty acid desaturase [Labilithrix sp.]